VTTKAWFFPIAHANDANFRAWGSDLSAAFAEVGLVKTADTGQIDWVTVTRPTLNTAAGYEIWRYTNSSVYLKIEYGTGVGAAAPGVWLTVGTGSNGSGTLTGTVSARTSVYANNSALDNPGTSRQSFLVYKDGFLGFFGYRFAAGGNAVLMGFWVSKTTNAAGVQDSRGATVYWRVGTSIPPWVQALNFQTNTALTVNTTGDFVVIPMAITSSIIGADTQCFIHWTALPLVLPNPYMATVISAEVPAGSTFTTTLIGTTPRTYIALDNVPHGSALGSAYRLAMLWE
jgi:hypothetical protein